MSEDRNSGVGAFRGLARGCCASVGCWCIVLAPVALLVLLAIR